MAARLKARSDIVARRRETVEHSFGSIKQWMGQGCLPDFGVINIVGIGAMIAAVEG